MKLKFLIATFVIIVFAGTGHGLGLQKRVHLQREFDLRAGSEAIVKETGLRVTFVKLVDDSRCPEGVTCIWAGNGKISLTVKYGKQAPVVFELNTMLEPKTFIHGNYDITLVKLAPYPKHDVTVSPRDYVATLKVTRRTVNTHKRAG